MRMNRVAPRVASHRKHLEPASVDKVKRVESGLLVGMRDVEEYAKLGHCLDELLARRRKPTPPCRESTTESRVSVVRERECSDTRSRHFYKTLRISIFRSMLKPEEQPHGTLKRRRANIFPHTHFMHSRIRESLRAKGVVLCKCSNEACRTRLDRGQKHDVSLGSSPLAKKRRGGLKADEYPTIGDSLLHENLR